MDQRILVESQIEDGKRFIDRLLEEGIAVTAACWLKENETGLWFLYIATPLVSPDGAKKQAYLRVIPMLRQMPQPFWLHPDEVKLIQSSHPIVATVHEMLQRYPGGRPIQLGEGRFGDVFVDGAYVYPPVPAPVPGR